MEVQIIDTLQEAQSLQKDVLESQYPQDYVLESSSLLEDVLKSPSHQEDVLESPSLLEDVLESTSLQEDVLEAPALQEDFVESPSNPAPPEMETPRGDQLSLEETDMFPPGEEPQELIDRLRPSSRIDISDENTNHLDISVPTQAIKFPKVYKCENCNKAFARHKSALNHCLKVFSWTCDKCGDVLGQRNNVARHRNRCQKRAEKQNLTRTEKVSMIEISDKECSLCGQSFKNNASMRAHVSRKHKEHKVGTHQCDKCDFKTMSQSQLKKHNTLVHNTTIAFKCQECDLSYFSKDGLRKHVRNVHENTSNDNSDMDDLSEGGIDEPDKGKQNESEDEEEPVQDVVSPSTKGPSDIEQLVVSEGMVEGSHQILLDMDTHETIEISQEEYLNNFIPQSNVSMVENVLNFNSF